jgi:hypothetical protein
MSKSNAFETDLLEMIFNAVEISSLDSTGGSTSLWVGLHEGDPGEAGDQTTNETAYTGYLRTETERSTESVGWTVASGSASPVSAITFPQATSTSTGTITYASVGLSSSGTGYLIYSGALSPTINYGQNVTPQLSTDSAITED